VKIGDRIAQLILEKIEDNVEIEEVKNLQKNYKRNSWIWILDKWL